MLVEFNLPQNETQASSALRSLPRRRSSKVDDAAIRQMGPLLDQSLLLV